MAEVALRGDISEGMFPSEVVLSFVDAAGKEISVIAPREFTVETDDGSVVRVRVLDIEGELYLIQLPGDVYGASNEVVVNQRQLQPV